MGYKDKTEKKFLRNHACGLKANKKRDSLLRIPFS
jgi:hypothetical protein